MTNNNEVTTKILSVCIFVMLLAVPVICNFGVGDVAEADETEKFSARHSSN